MRRWLTFAVGSAALCVIAGRPAWGNPAAGPTGVGAIPRYATPPSILVRWQDVPDETRYEVWREVDGGGIAKLADVAANVTQLRDNAVNTASTYRYRLFACDAAGCTIGNDFTTSVTASWYPSLLASTLWVPGGTMRGLSVS